MRKWTVPCIDNKTHKAIILSEVSYNAACMWLEGKLGKPNKVFIEGGMTTLEYPQVSYYYDEDRGILLKD